MLGDLKGLLSKANQGQLSWCLSIFVIFVLIIRKPSALLNPQFWAEDGTVFFVDAFSSGFSSLSITYADYFHTFPRLIAYLGGIFPITSVPFIYNICSLLLVLYILRFIVSEKVDIPHKYLFMQPLTLLFFKFIF